MSILAYKKFQAYTFSRISFALKMANSNTHVLVDISKYSCLSLSRTRLSQITAYLEVKIWSLPKFEQLTIGKKYCGKEEKLLLRSNFSSFPLFHNIFNISLTSRVQKHTYIFVKCGCSNYFFLNSANLICRGTDISKYFRESLGIRDNESRLYIVYIYIFFFFWENWI